MTATVDEPTTSASVVRLLELLAVVGEEALRAVLLERGAQALIGEHWACGLETRP